MEPRRGSGRRRGAKPTKEPPLKRVEMVAAQALAIWRRKMRGAVGVSMVEMVEWEEASTARNPRTDNRGEELEMVQGGNGG